MLRDDVVEAVSHGKFHVYAVTTIGEGIEILTGVPAGLKTNGAYPEGTVNYLVETRLKDYAEGLKKFAESVPEEKKDTCQKC